MKSWIAPVILCGGSGERLWPLSRKSYPKQFLSLIGEGSLFQQAITRLGDKTPPLIITGDDYRFIVRQQLLEIGVKKAEVIIEPVGKNTGPAVLAAAIHLASNDPNAIMLVMPSDHYIPNVQAFTDMVEKSANNLQKGQVICFGVMPDQPETGYGYIRIGDQDGVVKQVLGFTEKPTKERAEAFIKDGGYLWNAGIFMMRAGELLAIAAEIQPQMLEVAKRVVENAVKDLDFLRLDSAAWRDMPADSFDYAFMEKIKLIGCVAFEGKWSDLGNWQAVGDLSNADAHGNILNGAAYQIDSKHTLLWAEKESQVLTAIGLNNIMVISTGDAVLVADRERSQEVKAIVSELRSRGISQAEQRERDHRPWGWFETIVKNERFQFKILHLYSGGRLSLQSHRHRSEHWVVVKGIATVVCGEKEFRLHSNESIFIQAGTKHQLRNESAEELEVVEVQTGSYFGEDDIFRYHDIYGRI
ncbi:mannose-1-phosphate guanylyltransferase/mannose-6-phosphate isomerase [Alphaproteobacteria bacterium LSUCC0744]